MSTRIQLRRDTAAQWTSTNPVLAAGELGVETDTGKAKVGNGSTMWASLTYVAVPSAASTTDITTAINALKGGVSAAWDTLIEIQNAVTGDESTAAALATTVAGKAPKLTPTAVKTANYAAAAGDLVPVDTTSGAVTVTLPTAPADGAVLHVKHVIQGGTNTVTIACGGSDVINKAGGATSMTLTLLAQAALFQYKASSGIWYVIADDIALPQLDARFQHLPQTTEKTIYVGSGSNANDANDGLTPYSAKATLAAAKTALGGTIGKVKVGYGSYDLAAELDLDVIGMVLEGAGEILTTFNITAALTWGIKVTAGHCAVRDFTIQPTTGSVTYGVGVTCAPGGSAESCVFERVLTVGGTNGFAVGPDNAGSSTMDVSGTAFWHCRALAYYGNGWVVGNGTPANILNTSMYACIASGNTNIANGALGLSAVLCDGSNFSWRDGTVGNNTVSDFYQPHGTSGPVVISGVRSELSAKLWAATGNGSKYTVTLDGVVVASFTDASGNVIFHSVENPLTIIGGSFRGGPVPVSMLVRSGIDARPTPVTLINVVTDTDDPCPTQTSSVRSWIGLSKFSGSTIVPITGNGGIFTEQTSSVNGVGLANHFFIKPILGGAAQNLTNVLVALTGSRMSLNAADWTQVTGKTPKYRLCVTVCVGSAQVQNADVMEVEFYDADAAASYFNFTYTIPHVPTSNETFTVKSAFQAFPGSAKHGYLRARDQNGSRGQITAAWLEVQFS